MADAKLDASDFDRAYRVLWDIFHNVNNQLQFAEAKNAALLAANVATIIGIGAVVASGTVDLISVRAWLFVTSIGLGGGALVSLVSILPIIGPERHRLAGLRTNPMANLVYFGDISGASPTDYAEAILRQLEVAAAPAKLHVDLANQIVINSGIANRKFALFRLAARITAVVAVVPVLVLGAVWVGGGLVLH